MQQFSDQLQQALVDYAGTQHSDHVCTEADTECSIFDVLLMEIAAEVRRGITEAERERPD